MPKRRMILIAVFALLTSCKYINEAFPQITPEEAEEVKNICTNLAPPSSIKTGQVDFVRSGSALRSINYTSSVTAGELKNYYVNQLTHSGWSYTKEEDNLPRVRLRFRRNKYVIDVEYVESIFTQGSPYTVDCSIGLPWISP